ncbi:MAG: MarR family transcriptional regulator [Verrucomicrobiota bacterium]
MSLSKKNYESLASFRYILRTFLRFSEQAAGSVGLSASQHQALLAIQGYPGRSQITVGELAERLQVEHHSAVGLVDRLEANQFVQRTPHPEDRRSVLISLTAEGLRFLDQLAKVHRQELKKIGPELRSILQKLESEITSENDSPDKEV